MEDKWRLYALHRVLELLLLHLRPSLGATQGTLPEATYLHFVEALGLRATNPTTLHPFDCEFIRIEAAPRHARLDLDLDLARVRWPCLMLGLLLLQRAGVDVMASPDQLHPLAATNVLHWAHRRRDRPTADLSDGWGNNPQWRAPFRRDDRLGDMLHYQVGGALDLSQPCPWSTQPSRRSSRSTSSHGPSDGMSYATAASRGAPTARSCGPGRTPGPSPSPTHRDRCASRRASPPTPSRCSRHPRQLARVFVDGLHQAVTRGGEGGTHPGASSGPPHSRVPPNEGRRWGRGAQRSTQPRR